MGAVRNLGGGGLGSLLGVAAGIALAPATGGASLALYGLGGAALGGSLGSSIDAADESKDAARAQQSLNQSSDGRQSPAEQSQRIPIF